MMDGDDEYIQASKGKNVESFTCSEVALPQNKNAKKKKSKIENKRRFSDEQIRSLECIFESESKLEPRKKIQLARDLGLQPRQVAIWFQNRRARWKSKRIEQEYRKLKDEYDCLASRFESLKKEKDSLQLELKKLNDLMVVSASHHDGRRQEKVIAKGSRTDDGGSGSPHSNWRPNEEEEEAKTSFSNDTVPLPSDDKPDEERDHHRHHHHQDMRMDDEEQHLEIPLESLEKWYSEDPSGILDQSCSTSQWLDFWT
ncbi:hypothetical protein HN51_059108 [Arachis hypogaea]|uniref:homeobox-leucine zipper protein ATHB-12 n=1 Tax=Arachis ipaensis TaxID=130454 RepID=UPI0007AFD8FD|nr:homeobox-leucine zipper protein ATHB-12 [Arachis ipaensis]XP_025683040.1 homeobox-leucine zipper protein ATHB-12 [Arachis hypogaea]